MQVVQHAPGVDEVLEDVVAEDRVKRLIEVAEHLLDRSNYHLVVHPARALGGGRVDLDANETLGVRPKRGPHGSGSASHVEDAPQRTRQCGYHVAALLLVVPGYLGARAHRLAVS